MKQNMSSTDRIIRAIVAVVLAALIYFNVLTGTAAVVLGIIAGIFLVTALIGFCPLYALFKLSTNK
ncbi:hypothetical protein Pelsub_P2155 [Pelolinea submarina]|uniref:DUF2892 family protein n=2 Tax=Pelolinea submarina TaxID=913107 RepID=A0A347ZUE3_9CHLR|nr:DUF2892 family protein [Pelolinea submarina]BBB48924.1 hypothetical protein Pelsub_P2155 [Pelolinea submarina]